jgi:hypothetical protein
MYFILFCAHTDSMGFAHKTNSHKIAPAKLVHKALNSAQTRERVTNYIPEYEFKNTQEKSGVPRAGVS